ncbi:unnamed protein product [Rhizoctonia solani]|uniref:Fungal lipase-type domain-containing protein n=1 Tax=Rhizoctonia solani TaxID=456999 RepID=A0A8H3CXB3_9AGAM|nr:unnamed protein product [Rhizoctonia solani]
MDSCRVDRYPSPTAMVFRASLITTLLIGAGTITASPALVSRAEVTSLSLSQVEAFKPYALLARAAFCPPDKLKTWSCGTACNDLSWTDVVATNNEGDPMEAGWFVGYYPELKTIVVSNQGTDPSEIEASLTDADSYMTELDSTLFPGVPSGVQVHNGFEMSQAKSAKAKLDAVNALIADYGPSTVTLTGLGRGGAISFLDAIYLLLHLPSSIKLKVVTHGMPRVGNQAFANYIDSHLPGVSRITNQKDPLPILPGRFLGYHHSSGEKHIIAEDDWVACAGQDNTDKQCSTGDVPNIFEGRVEDNTGPYNGVYINGTACAA